MFKTFELFFSVFARFKVTRYEFIWLNSFKAQIYRNHKKKKIKSIWDEAYGILLMFISQRVPNTAKTENIYQKYKMMS